MLSWSQRYSSLIPNAIKLNFKLLLNYKGNRKPFAYRGFEKYKNIKV